MNYHNIVKLCRTRRKWRPNVHWKRLYSIALDQWIDFRVTTHALRCIDKAGGIDEYLTKTPTRKLDSDVGEHWKMEIWKALRQEQGVGSKVDIDKSKTESVEV